MQNVILITLTLAAISILGVLASVATGLPVWNWPPVLRLGFAAFVVVATAIVTQRD